MFFFFQFGVYFFIFVESLSMRIDISMNGRSDEVEEDLLRAGLVENGNE